MYKILVERFYNGQAAIATLLTFDDKHAADTAYQRLQETKPSKSTVLSTIITCLY